MLESVWQDTWFALRTLRRQPGFAAIAVLTLALGIGANAAIFSVIDTLLLRPPRFAYLNRLVSFQESNPQKIPFDVDPSPGNFLDWRREVHSFDELAAWRNWYFTLSEPWRAGSAPEAVRGVNVSPNFFSMIGVSPVLGRAFRNDEEQPGNNRVVMLSDRLWARRFARNSEIVDRQVLVDGIRCTVIGVLPPDFQFFQPDLDLWMPLAVDASLQNRENHSVSVFGRLSAGVTLAQGAAEMDAIARGLAEAHPDTDAGWSIRVRPLYPTTPVRQLKPALLVLLAASSLVLLIACANVANLLLARAISRQREIAIRTAVGASRSRLIRQIVTESLLLAAISGIAAVLIAIRGIALLVPLLPHVGTNTTVAAFRAVSPSLDARTLVFSIAVSMLTGIAFSTFPAFQMTRVDMLRVGTGSSLKPRAGRMLLGAELALAVVLLTAAGLLLETFWNLQHVDSGFQTDHLLTMQVWLPKTAYPSGADVRRFYNDVIRRVDTLPGVRGTTAISYRPFLGMGTGTAIEIDGASVSRDGAPPVTGYRVVAPGFLRVLGQPLVAGSDFTAHDAEESEGVAIVNEAMAQRYWPGMNPIGQRVRPAFRQSTVPWEMDATPRWLTVVGVARNIRGFSLNQLDESQMYVSSLQFPSSYMFLIVRTATQPLGLAAAVQDQIRAVDPDQPVGDVRTMEDAVSASVPRFNVELLVIFALIAVFLAAVGVYGVSSYTVSQRRREIGVRMALGAESTDLLVMIFSETLSVGVIAVAAGLFGSVAVMRMLAALLYGVAPTGPLAYASAAGFLLTVVLFAAYLPARRASHVDPVFALRAE